MRTLKDLIDSKIDGFCRCYNKKADFIFSIVITVVGDKVTLSPDVDKSEYTDCIVLHGAENYHYDVCKVDNEERIGWEKCSELGRYINKKTGELEYLVRLEEGGSRIVKESEMLRHGKNDDVFMNWIKENK